MAEAVLVVNFPRTPGVVDFALFALILVLSLTRQRDRDEGTGATWALAAKVAPVPERLREVWWIAHLGTIVAGVGLAAAVLLPMIVTTAERRSARRKTCENRAPRH